LLTIYTFGFYLLRLQKPQIGIFWLYKSVVIAKQEDLNTLTCDSMGLYDSDLSHAVEWEEKRIYRPFFPELESSQYEEFSRGRVIYSANDNVFRIYADRKIVKSAKSRSAIIEKFKLSNSAYMWLLDPHYKVFR